METEQKSDAAVPNASWGAIISIVVILAMIVIGASYSWKKRVEQMHTVPSSSATSTQN